MLHLTKHHGLGNDFLVALAERNPGLVPDPAVARALCDRHLGIGADGLLHALAPDRPGADARMVLLNADGSEAEISGNGIRCLAQAILMAADRTEGDLLIDTPGGRRRVRVLGGDVRGVALLEVDMGGVRAGPALTPDAAAEPAANRATVDVGNPHLVLQVDDVDAVDLEEVGPRLEAGFAAGINVHVVEPAGPSGLRLRVWERGVGITRACGSGAVAAAAAAHGWGVVGNEVTVTMPGGDATVVLTADGALLAGPSTYVAEVTVPHDPRGGGRDR
ncbi:MAG: diaminopimelate epimerase [Microthrixaceae bacterium]